MAKRHFMVVWGFMECLVFGGLLYGWPSLVFVLKEEGIYSSLCPEGNSTRVVVNSTVEYLVNGSDAQGQESGTKEQSRQCRLQDQRLSLVFTVGSALFCVGCAIMGQINFKFGTRVTRIASMCVFLAGSLMIAFVTPERSWLIFPGLTFLGIGGIPLLMTNTQIAMLFGTSGSFVVGLMCGAFDASSGVQQLVKIAFDNGIHHQYAYYLISALHLLVLVSTFLWMPKMFFEKEVKPASQDVNVAYSTEGEGPQVEVLLPGTNGVKSDAEKAAEPTLKNCILNPVYLLHVLWLSVLQLRFYFFLGSLNPLMEMYAEGDPDEKTSAVSYYTNVSLYTMMVGVITSPLTGAFYDLMIKVFSKKALQVQRELLPAVVPLGLTVVLATCLSVLILVPYLSVLYATFIFLVLFRSFLYSMGAAFISTLFPSHFFGLLYGIMIIIGGIFSFFTYPLFAWAGAAGFLQVNAFLIGLNLVALLHPGFLWFKCHRAAREAMISE